MNNVNKIKLLCHPEDYFFEVSVLKINKSTGNKIKLVMVAVTKVKEISQPSANVPPKLLAQKMTNPAVNTKDV